MGDQDMTRNPIAPSLSEFLKDGGAETYIPRPEWCRCLSSEDEHDLISVNSMENNSYLPCHDCGERYLQSGSLGNSQWERGLILDHSEFSPRIPSPPLSLAVPVTEYNVENHDTAAAFARSIIYHKVYPGINQSPRSITFDVLNIRDLQDGQLNTKHEVSSLHRKSNESIQDSSFFGKDKNSALHEAIKNSCKAAALKLIQYGANPVYRNRNGVTPLILAAQKGDLDVIIALLEHGANPCESNGHSSALIEASHFGNYDIVKILLEKGAFINQKTLTGTTALMRASQEGHANIVKMLISYNADIECKTQDGMNALILAARRGHLDVVQILLRIGCRVNESTSKQSTALMLACKHGHSDIAIALMTHGAELSIKDNHGRSAVSFAERNVNMSTMVPILTIDAQLYFMRKHEACQRSFMFIKMWKLFNENRASISANSEGRRVSVTSNHTHDESILSQISETKQVMVRTMTLPVPLVGLIASFLPLPVLVEKHSEMLQRRRNVDPTSTISCALDLIDDILESIGFVDAWDKSKLVAPTGYWNWVSSY